MSAQSQTIFVATASCPRDRLRDLYTRLLERTPRSDRSDFISAREPEYFEAHCWTLPSLEAVAVDGQVHFVHRFASSGEYSRLKASATQWMAACTRSFVYCSGSFAVSDRVETRFTAKYGLERHPGNASETSPFVELGFDHRFVDALGYDTAMSWWSVLLEAMGLSEHVQLGRPWGIDLLFHAASGSSHVVQSISHQDTPISLIVRRIQDVPRAASMVERALAALEELSESMQLARRSMVLRVPQGRYAELREDLNSHAAGWELNGFGQLRVAPFTSDDYTWAPLVSWMRTERSDEECRLLISATGDSRVQVSASLDACDLAAAQLCAHLCEVTQLDFVAEPTPANCARSMPA